MLPILFKIGTFEVRSFGVALMLAFVVAMFVARARAPRFGIQPDKIVDLSFWTIIAGILGARICYMLLNASYFAKHTNEIYSFRFEGLTSFGGLIGGAVAATFWIRKHDYPAKAVLDMLAVPMLLGHAIGRVGCLLNGCCYGKACSLPWAVHMQGNLTPVHPAQFYDTLVTLLGAGILVLWERRSFKLGQSFSAMLFIYGLSRFIFEFWRDPSTAKPLIGPMTEAQTTASVMILGGLIMFWLCSRERKQETSVKSGTENADLGTL